MALIENVNYHFVRMDSYKCSASECPHYATVVLVQVDRFNGNSRLYCTEHLIRAAKHVHWSENARKRWL